MIKIDWNTAPEDATHILLVKDGLVRASAFYKIVNNKLQWFASYNRWIPSSHPLELLLIGGNEYYKFIPRIKPRIICKEKYSYQYHPGNPLVERFVKLALAEC